MDHMKNNSSTPAQNKQGIQRVIDVAGSENWERAITQVKVKVKQQAVAAAAQAAAVAGVAGGAVAGVATGTPPHPLVAGQQPAATTQSTEAKQQQELFRAMSPQLQQASHSSCTLWA